MKRRAVQSNDRTEIDLFIGNHRVGNIKREYGQNWIVRTVTGGFLDSSAFRNDLIERFNSGEYDG